MSYTIGIGILLDEKTCNKLRNLELSLYEKNKNTSGLGQPPHITIKVPFAVPRLKEVETTANFMAELASKTNSFDIHLKDFGNFGKKVIYAKVSDNEVIHKLSMTSIEHLAPIDEQQDEKSNMIFHSTLAMHLTPREYEISQKSLVNEIMDINAKAIGLGLFLGIDNFTHWAVIRQVNFL